LIEGATGEGGYMATVEGGEYVLFTDHSSRVRELEETIKNLAVGVVFVSRELCRERGWSESRIADVWPDCVDEDPIAANAVKEAGR
jgi:hypothetical protein